MNKVNEIPASPMDFLLLPVWVHKRLSVNIKGLLLAFLFVGTFDMLFYHNIFEAGYFRGNVYQLGIRLILFVILSFVLGAIDVICTMVPISEFAIMIGKRSEKFVNSRIPIILMKSYALSHLLFIIPTAYYIYAGVDWNNINQSSSPQLRLIFSILVVVLSFMPFFQLGIIYRTVSIRTRIQIFGKLILIMATYFWMRISGGAILFFEEIFSGIMGQLP